MDWKMMVKQVKEHFKIVIGIGLVLILIIYFGLRSLTHDASDALVLPEQSVTTPKSEQPTAKQSNESQISEASKQILVDIKGAVKNPGVYKVASHARVNDVVVLAGGLTPQADGKSINLAQKVTDEMIIYVASVGENVTALPSSAPDKASTGQSGATTAPSDKVNINTADLTELQTLSGVGAKRAQDIIDYREQNGPFKTPEDLGKVSGFGEKTIEKLKESITVD
ncbi:competence protein [Bacilli bacterium]|nr:competence protein [Bacilli bacterium]GHU45647.1 competence protein [Bacilli bacterium]